MSIGQVCFSFRYDRERGREFFAVNRYEKIQVDSFAVFFGMYGIEYSSGISSCLFQGFDIELLYTNGNESCAGTHDIDFALGKAACLDCSIESIQNYNGGCESLMNSHDVFFALGRSNCLYQTFRIDQPYTGGSEQWPSLHETFCPGRTDILVQSLDVVRSYNGGREEWTVRLDCVVQSATSQMFMFDTENFATVGPGTGIYGIYEIRTNSAVDTNFLYDRIGKDRYFELASFYDCRMLFHYLVTAVNGEVMIDTLNRLPRSFDLASVFEVTERYSFDLPNRYEYVEAGSISLPDTYGIANAGYFLLRLQEEAYYEYTACLTNVHTGFVSTVMTTDLHESLGELEQQCLGDAEWQLEYAVTARFYDPDRPDQLRDPVRWRFVMKDGEHWKPGPIVYDVRAVRLPSFMELHFNADRPYRSIESLIEANQFRSTREDDYFDLGVWISDSIWIDTDEQPVLTIPYASDTSDYNVHVPRRETTRYIGIAPIRRFPYEEVGALSVIFIP